MTVSVGTTTLRTARCCPSETTRCSRLCLTLFSCPEYVFTTYQRNIQIQRSSQDEFNDFLGDVVRGAEVQTSNCDEAEHDGRRLEDVTAVRPLDTLQLGPAGAQKADRAVAFANRGAGCLLGADATVGAAATGTPAHRRAGWFLKFVLADVALGQRLGLDFALGEVVDVGALVGIERHAAGAADERGVELVGVSGVLERSRHVRLAGKLRQRVGCAVRAAACGCLTAASGRGRAACAALLCTFAVTSHDSAPALTGLPVAGVLATPTAVLAQADPVGVVALALVCLVVAMLALLAREGDSNTNVSAGHDQKSLRRCLLAAPGEEKHRPGARCKQSSALAKRRRLRRGSTAARRLSRSVAKSAQVPAPALDGGRTNGEARAAQTQPRCPPANLDKPEGDTRDARTRADPCQRPRRELRGSHLPHTRRTRARAADRHRGAGGDVRAPRAAVEGDAAGHRAEEAAWRDEAQDRGPRVLRHAHLRQRAHRVLA